MKNFILEGHTLTVTPGAAYTSGGVYISGLCIGIYTATGASGVPVAIKTNGVFELPKVSAQAWATPGLPIYWDSGAGLATTVSTSNTLLGYNSEVAANPSSVGRVRLIPRAA